MLSCYQNNASNCKYYDLKEIKPLTKLNDKSFLLVSYLNTCSISKHSEDLEYFFDSNNFNFDFINTSETRITKNKSPINNIDLTNYSYEHCPTESWAGGTPLQFKNHLSYKNRDDLNIYKSAELDSTFIKTINRKKIKYISVYQSNISINMMCLHTTFSI